MTLLAPSPRPKLVLPFQTIQQNCFSGRSNQTYRARFQEAKETREIITMDDILAIRRQKQLLLQEKAEIVAKIARIEQLSTHHQSDAINKQIADSLEKQVKNMERLIEEKKSETSSVINSDTAASITETQEESKIYHLELVRLKEEKANIEAENLEASQKLEAMLEEYDPSQLRKVEEQIANLKIQIKKIESSIDIKEHPEKYFKSVKERQEREEEEEAIRQDYMNRIKEFQNAIKDEKRNITMIKNQLNEAN